MEKQYSLDHTPALIRSRLLCQILGISKSALYAWVRKGFFPPPIRCGQRFTAWRRHDVEAWLASRSHSTD